MMKTCYTTLFAALLCLAAACSDEADHPAPSRADIDWFARTDNPADALDHRLYEIYRRSGIGIFYSDTLGSQTRGTWADGTPYVFHYVVDLAYSIDGSGGEWGSQMTIDVRTPKARRGVDKAVDLLEEYVLPRLPEGMRPKCILLFDSMIYQPFNPTEEVDLRDLRSLKRAFRGMNALGLAGLDRLETMPREEQIEWAAGALAACYAADLMQWDEVRMRDFYALSAMPGQVDKYYFSEAVWGDMDEDYMPFIPSWESYGFLYWSEEFGLSYITEDLEMQGLDPAVLEQLREGVNNFRDNASLTRYISHYNLPTRREDVEAFLAAALTAHLADSDALFEARYDREAFPTLYAKYELMKRIAAAYMADKINP